MVSNDISPRGWKNSLESLLDTEELPSSPDRCQEELISHKKVSSVDNLHLKPLASLPSTEVKTSSSSKASSLGSSKGKQPVQMKKSVNRHFLNRLLMFIPNEPEMKKQLKYIMMYIRIKRMVKEFMNSF